MTSVSLPLLSEARTMNPSAFASFTEAAASGSSHASRTPCEQISRLRHVADKQRLNEFDFFPRGDARLSCWAVDSHSGPGRARLAVKPHLRDIKGEDGVHKCGGGFVLALQPIIWEHLEQFKPTLRDWPVGHSELGNKKKSLARELVNTCYFSTLILLQIEKNVAEVRAEVYMELAERGKKSIYLVAFSSAAARNFQKADWKPQDSWWFLKVWTVEEQPDQETHVHAAN